MSKTAQNVAILVAVSIGTAALVGAGYFVSNRRNAAIPRNNVSSDAAAAKTANAELAKVVAQDGRLPPPPLALPEMRKAVRLEEENPDAFRAQYLDRRYRVVGKVASIIGSTDRELRTADEPVDIAGDVIAEDARSHNDNGGLIFRLNLEPWDFPSGPLVSAPDLAFDDLPASTRLAIRPGERIDANCTLTSAEVMFVFEHCQLNKISRN
jgi:hypothetical protein